MMILTVQSKKSSSVIVMRVYVSAFLGSVKRTSIRFLREEHRLLY